MLLPGKQRLAFHSSPKEQDVNPVFHQMRWINLLTFLVGAVLLIDQQLETYFDAAPINSIDLESRKVSTDMGAFLAEFTSKGGPALVESELIVMEFSPITKTVVAYKPYTALLVDQPRECIFSYWPLILLMTVVSFVLVTAWNIISYRYELLTLNIILIFIILLLFIVTR